MKSEFPIINCESFYWVKSDNEYILQKGEKKLSKIVKQTDGTFLVYPFIKENFVHLYSSLDTAINHIESRLTIVEKRCDFCGFIHY